MFKITSYRKLRTKRSLEKLGVKNSEKNCKKSKLSTPPKIVGNGELAVSMMLLVGDDKSSKTNDDVDTYLYYFLQN